MPRPNAPRAVGQAVEPDASLLPALDEAYLHLELFSENLIDDREYSKTQCLFSQRAIHRCTLRATSMNE